MNTTTQVAYRTVQAESYYSSQRRLPGWLPDLPQADPDQGQHLYVMSRVIIMDKRTSGVLVQASPIDGEYHIGVGSTVRVNEDTLMQDIRRVAQGNVRDVIGEGFAQIVASMHTQQSSGMEKPQYRLQHYTSAPGGEYFGVLEVVVLLKVDKNKIEIDEGTLITESDWRSVAWLKSITEPGCKLKLASGSKSIVESNMIASLNASLHAPARGKF